MGNYKISQYFIHILDGITAAIKINSLIKENILPVIPIIACTAFSSKNDVEICYSSGMQDFVTKPINLLKV